MRRRSFISLVLVSALAFACSRSPERVVQGSDWLDESVGGSIYDVLMYPITGDELVWFETALPLIEAAAKENPADWEQVVGSDDPVFSASQKRFWRKTDLSGQDVVALSLKLTFLQEFASADDTMEREMRENLHWLEQRLQNQGADAELTNSADTIRALLKVIEAHRADQAFQRYSAEQDRYDAALDRFTSIGENLPNS